MQFFISLQEKKIKKKQSKPTINRQRTHLETRRWEGEQKQRISACLNLSVFTKPSHQYLFSQPSENMHIWYWQDLCGSLGTSVASCALSFCRPLFSGMTRHSVWEPFTCLQWAAECPPEDGSGFMTYLFWSHRVFCCEFWLLEKPAHTLPPVAALLSLYAWFHLLTVSCLFSKASLTEGSYMEQIFTKSLGMTTGL